MNLDRIGKYRVVGRIGEGAMGEVYKAHDPLLNRYVAVKTISPALAANAEFRRRFQREAQSAAQLNHPNVVTIFDFGEEPGTGLTYMAMEYLEGQDLRSAIRSHGIAHLGQKLSVIEQLCEGLAFAHSRGVVHRDLKPGNIHLQPNGQVKVLDFGLARLGGSELTRTGTVLGTPNYMAPEQVRGQKADARCDVFSLGSVFYEILTGRRAFDAASMAEVLQSICDREPEPIRRCAPETPAALVAIVERALRKKPEERFADAGEMSRALAAARDTIAGETLAVPGTHDAEATLIEPRSVVGPAGRSRMSVAGANALTLQREAGARSQLATMRTPGTHPGPPPTHVPDTEPAPSHGRALALGLGALALAGLLAGGLWLRGRGAAVAPSATVAQEQLDILTEQLALSKIELARADLDNRDYPAAADHAREVLKIDARNADALAILERAQGAQRDLEKAVSDARGALAAGDTASAATALGRVLALDPRHPAAVELSGQLDRYFRGQADEAKRAAGEARAAAEAARAGASAAFAPARRQLDEAEALFKREKYAAATQKYLESRNGFEAARREADAARAATAAEAARAAAAAEAERRAAASPSPASVRGPVLPSPSVAPQPVSPPTAAPAAAPTATPAAAAAPAAAATPSRVAEGPEGPVRRVIADYVRAIETRDVPLFRSLMPDIGADGEKRLRDAFAAVKSQTVGITIEAIQLEAGDQATVQVLRQDTINGRQQKAMRQVFRLAQAGGVWRIASMKAQ